jgi:hypothetical protein
VLTQAQDWEAQRLWREDRDRRMAARQAEQARLHALDPANEPLYIPADDPEFGTEAHTAGWTDEEPDVEPGFVHWDGDDSEDAADSTAADLDTGLQPTGEHLIAMVGTDLGYPVYPDDELGRPHHGCKVWALFAVCSDSDGEWWPELVPGTAGLTLAEVQELAATMRITRLLLG